MRRLCRQLRESGSKISQSLIQKKGEAPADNKARSEKRG